MEEWGEHISGQRVLTQHAQVLMLAHVCRLCSEEEEAEGQGDPQLHSGWRPVGAGLRASSAGSGLTSQGFSHPISTLCSLLLQLLSKYDPQKEAELRSWIEGLTGLSIGPDFQKGLKDGVILCT